MCQLAYDSSEPLIVKLTRLTAELSDHIGSVSTTKRNSIEDGVLRPKQLTGYPARGLVFDGKPSSRLGLSLFLWTLARRSRLKIAAVEPALISQDPRFWVLWRHNNNLQGGSTCLSIQKLAPTVAIRRYVEGEAPQH